MHLERFPAFSLFWLGRFSPCCAPVVALDEVLLDEDVSDGPAVAAGVATVLEVAKELARFFPRSP